LGIRKLFKNKFSFLVGTLTVLLFVGIATPAFGATGDLLSCLEVDETASGSFNSIDGIGIGFDGTDLYYTKGFFGTPGFLNKIPAVIGLTGSCVTAGVDGTLVARTAAIPIISGGGDIPNVGCDAIAFDTDTKNRFWCASSGFDVYTVDIPSGVATFRFNADVQTRGCGNGSFIPPSAPTPGDCDDNFEGGGPFDGMSFDPSDGTIWYAPDASIVIFHYDQAGVFLGSFRIDTGAGDMEPDCDSEGVGFSFSSGIAATRLNNLFLGADGCDTIFQHSTAGVKLASSAIGSARHEGLECDDMTFSSQGVDGIWIKDAADDLIRAFEVPKGTCAFIRALPSAVGGDFIPMDTTTLLLAGTQSTAAWMIPAIVSTIGIGIVIARKF